MKTALVTGGGKRVGAHLVRHLAVSGWQMAIHCHTSRDDAVALAAEVNAQGGKACVLQQDMRDAEAMASLMKRATEDLGPITLLVHNASLFEKDRLEGLEIDSWQDHHTINLLSPVLLTKAFVAQAPSGASIICLLDGMRGWSVSPTFFSYAMSRMGMENFIALMANDLAPRIRINGIQLGPTLPGHQDKPGTFDKLGRLLPMQRISSPEEVCRAVDFLLEMEGVTGQLFDLSGGMNLLGHRIAD